MCKLVFAKTPPRVTVAAVEPAVGGPLVQRLEHGFGHLPRGLGRQRAAVWRGECQFAVFATGGIPATLLSDSQHAMGERIALMESGRRWNL